MSHAPRHTQTQDNPANKVSWANEICEDDSEERAITLATMHEVAYIVQIWLPLIVWQQVDAPQYHKGYITATVMSSVMIVVCLVVRALNKREVKMKRMEDPQAEAEAKDGQGSESEGKGKTNEEVPHLNKNDNMEAEAEAEAPTAIQMEVVRPSKMC